MPNTPVFPEPLDLSGLTEQQQLAFLGALFAVAASDDDIDQVESEQILDAFDFNGLSEPARERVFALSIAPPPLQACLEPLRDAPEDIRLGLMLNLVDVALADGEIEPGEPMSLEQARTALGVIPEQVEGMHAFVFRARQQAEAQKVPLPRPMACPAELVG